MQTGSKIGCELLSGMVGIWAITGGLTVRAQIPPIAGGSAASTQAESRLATGIDAVLDAPEMESAFLGAYVVRVRDGRVLYSRNADRVFLPASNNKLLTSFAALETLPLDFAYRTQIRATGKVDEEGVLHGDLVLVGGGDPILSLEDLDDLAKQVARAGIHSVRGALRFDDSRYDRQWLGDGWTWDDEAAAYSAQVSALNVNSNCVQVQVWPGKKPGAPGRVQISPATDYVAVDNRTITVENPQGERAGSSGSPLNIDRAHARNVVSVTGNAIKKVAPRSSGVQAAHPVSEGGGVSVGTKTEAKTEAKQGIQDESAAPPVMTVSVTVEDPARFTSTLFLQALRRAGVTVGNAHRLPVSEAIPGVTSTVIAQHSSPTLPELLARMNKPSDNLMAECLLKAVGAFGQVPTTGATPTGTVSTTELRQVPRIGTGGSSGTGAQVARKAFLAAGFQPNGVSQADGSGLSRLDYVSPRNLVRLLTVAQTRPYWPSFYASLPIAGVDGTLRNRLKGTVAQNNCHAKTGTLSHVSSLTGYVTDRNGDLIAFAILINNNLSQSRTSTHTQDSIVQILAEQGTRVEK